MYIIKLYSIDMVNVDDKINNVKKETPMTPSPETVKDELSPSMDEPTPKKKRLSFKNLGKGFGSPGDLFNAIKKRRKSSSSK